MKEETGVRKFASIAGVRGAEVNSSGARINRIKILTARGTATRDVQRVLKALNILDCVYGESFGARSDINSHLRK